MSLLAPLWLIGLLPWTILVVWLLSGRHESQGVPFLNLWLGSDQTIPQKPKHSLVRPPFWLTLILLAMFLAIVGASRPRLWKLPYTQGQPITIILDRGLSMTAAPNGEPRWKSIAQAIRFPLQNRFGIGDTRLILVPENQTIDTNRPGWLSFANNSDAPAADTRGQLEPIISRELHRRDALIFVITDQHLAIDDERVIQVPPLVGANNVGIVRAGATASPRPAVLVRLRNDSDRRSAELKIGSRDPKNLDLPPRGQEKDYFFDLEELPGEISIQLVSSDNQPLDNRASLVRESAWPMAQERGDRLPASIRRIIETYGKVRPATQGMSSVVNITQDSAAIGRSIIAPPASQPAMQDELHIVDHPITQHIDWKKALMNASIRPAPPGWTPLVSLGDRPIVAIRQEPERQAWIGFSSPEFALTTDFVILWTNAIDWTGQGGSEFRFNGTSVMPIETWPNPTWPEILQNIPGIRRGGIDLASPLLIISLLLIAIAFASRTQRR